ncbi:glycerol-3-phosphate acyltransferase 4-like isoform X3 [Cherax quadricarinatus]|uniref:glycerol-3-phosphate acyltransferase 4-like isoform X3 n=1 Tax=Cherax quadricarinatus TaxID=27406 RepID=UPI00387E7CB0
MVWKFVDTIWESLIGLEYINSQRVWEVLRPLVIWGQLFVFIYFLLVATVGRRLKIRRKYVEFLDRLFHFAEVRLTEEPLEEEEDEPVENGGVVICPESPRAESSSSMGSFSFQDPMPYLAAGMRAVVQDCVSKSFTPAELRTWNMLSRTRRKLSLRMSPSLTVFWAMGFVVRWVFLMPVRVLLLVLSLTTLVVLCSAVGLLPTSDFKRRLNAGVVTWCFDFIAGSLSVVARIEKHAQDHTKPPILMFPEGICNNNTVVLQFKKGAFEIDSDIFPVAIKFDLRYGDPFWYQNTFGAYIFSMMTSWAIVCDVWYLPLTRRRQQESAVAFANRVKALIAHRGGFVELVWDGFVKYTKSLELKQDQWRKRQQIEFVRHFNLSNAHKSIEKMF